MTSSFSEHSRALVFPHMKKTNKTKEKQKARKVKTKEETKHKT